MNKRKNDAVFSLLGAATGLANACRFPVACVRFGFCFVLVYAISLFAIGLPLLCAELSYGQGKSGGRGVCAIMRAARVNSALIALYYGGNAIKLASAAGEYALCGGVVSSPYITGLTAVLFVFAFLGAAKFGLASTGRAAVFAYFALFVPLALLGLGQGGISFRWSELCGGGIWCEGVGQVLLALSLSCGVMPSFAAKYGNGFSPFRLALTVVCVNFFGCVLSALAVAPYCGGIFARADAVSVFSCVADGVFKNGLARCVFGCGVFLSLALVAVNGALSLAFPFIRSVGKNRNGVTVAFSVAVAALTPLFLADEWGVAVCCDRVACCVTAVIISVAESLCFCTSGKTPLSLRIVSGCVCLPCCVAVFFLSSCSARFVGFSALSLACGGLYALLPPVTALLPVTMRKFKGGKNERFYQKRKVIRKKFKMGIAQRRYP